MSWSYTQLYNKDLFYKKTVLAQNSMQNMNLYCSDNISEHQKKMYPSWLMLNNKATLPM